MIKYNQFIFCLIFLFIIFQKEIISESKIFEFYDNSLDNIHSNSNSHGHVINISSSSSDYGDYMPMSKCGDHCQIGQVCRNSTCSTCLNNQECYELNNQWICSSGLCTHKTLFHNKFTSIDLIGFILLFIACAMSSGGGVGGGGIYIPILILVSKWDPKTAIPLSNCLVAGCSLANLIQNFSRRHPHADRHLIDYSVALLIEPLTLMGTIFGVYLHTLFPPLLILLLLVVTLSFTAFKTFTKGYDIYKKEKKLKDSLIIRSDNNSINGATYDPFGEGSTKPRFYYFFDADWAKISILLVILIVSTLFSIFKGGNDEYSVVGVKLCSPSYWVLSFITVPLIIITWIFTSKYLFRESQLKIQEGRVVEGEIQYTKKNIMLLGFLSVIAGCLASLLGIGGGMIKGPVLLQMGLSPDVTAATSSYMILFTSASSAFQYILVGKLRLDYGIIYYLIGFFSCFVGTQTLIWVVNKYKRRSYIVFLIGFVIGISTILLCITEGIDFVKYRNLTFDSICTPASPSP